MCYLILPETGTPTLWMLSSLETLDGVPKPESSACENSEIAREN